MAKVRLNQERRNTLRRLAYTKLQQTPADPALVKRIEDGEVAYKKTQSDFMDAVKACMKNSLPEAHVKVLRKYGLTRKQESVVISSADMTRQTSVCLFDEASWIASQPDPKTLNVVQLKEYRAAKEKAVEESKIEVAYRVPGKVELRGFYVYPQEVPFIVEDEIFDLQKEIEKAKAEWEMAKQTLREQRAKIEYDFAALIDGSRYFEDVVEVWPEAKEVTAEIVGTGNLPSLMSEDAKARIAANMAARGIVASTASA